MSIPQPEQTAEQKKAALVKQLNEGLPNFTGSASFLRYQWGLVLTEGVEWLANTAACWWLIDVIGTNSMMKHILQKEPWLTCKLLVNEKGNWSVTFEDGNYNYLDGQKGTCTDFPLPEITLWAIKNEFGGRTLMLPSEY